MGARVRTELRLKVQLSAALALGFCVPYFVLQAMPLFPVRTLPLSSIDRAVGFSPGWIWVYQSVYLLLAGVPWLAGERGTLRRYARGFALLSVIGFICFLCVPIAAPRPADVPTTGMFGLLVSYDGVLNSLPSLHCALAAYSVLLARRLCRESASAAVRVVVPVGLAAWCLAIAYATLATKQHYFVDVPPGILLAWLGDRWAWRSAAPAAAGAGWVRAEAGRV
jgi:membrane-associated phospholipid phosphatase